MSAPNFSLASKTLRRSVAVGLIAVCLVTPAVGQTIIFGSDNDGFGGFTSGAAVGLTTPAPAWTLETNSVVFTNDPTGPGVPPDSGQVNASLLDQFTLDRTAGNSYTIMGIVDLTSTYAADNNRVGLSLFATSDDLAGVETGLSLQLNLGSGNLVIRNGGVSVGTNLTVVALSGVTSTDLIGETLTFTADIDFVGANIEIDFTLAAPSLAYSQTISGTVAAASFTGENFGFGSRGRVRNGNAAFIYGVESFSIVPEPSSLALLGGGLSVLGLLRRRRTASN